MWHNLLFWRLLSAYTMPSNILQKLDINRCSAFVMSGKVGLLMVTTPPDIFMPQTEHCSDAQSQISRIFVCASDRQLTYPEEQHNIYYQYKNSAYHAQLLNYDGINKVTACLLQIIPFNRIAGTFPKEMARGNGYIRMSLLRLSGAYFWNIHRRSPSVRPGGKVKIRACQSPPCKYKFQISQGSGRHKYEQQYGDTNITVISRQSQIGAMIYHQYHHQIDRSSE